MTEPSGDATVLLKQWQRGDQVALNELIRVLTPELRRSAGQIAGPNQHRYLLQPTELVNEALIRLLDVDNIDWKNRAHFLAIAAITMRRVLVDEARRFATAKRSRIDVTLNDGIFAAASMSNIIDVLDVENALNQLQQLFPDRCRIVELKFFSGMSNKEIAEVENISLSTVKRQWRAARVWMLDNLSSVT